MASVRKAHQRWTCPLCGADMAVRYQKKHVDAPECLVTRTLGEMRARGYARCHGTHQTLAGVGIEILRAPIYTDKELKGGYMEGYWGPAWAVRVAKLTDSLSSGARHVILHHWSRVLDDPRTQGTFETLLASDATGAGLFIACLQRGRCCDHRLLGPLWRKAERGEWDKITKLHTNTGFNSVARGDQ